MQLKGGGRRLAGFRFFQRGWSFTRGGTADPPASRPRPISAGTDPWETVGTVTLDANGDVPVIQVEDTGGTGAGKSFFRIAVP